MVQTLDLAELYGVDGEADVTVSGEPCSMVMVVRLVSVAYAALLHPTVTAYVQNGGKFLTFLAFGRQVQVARDV